MEKGIGGRGEKVLQGKGDWQRVGMGGKHIFILTFFKTRNLFLRLLLFTHIFYPHCTLFQQGV